MVRCRSSLAGFFFLLITPLAAADKPDPALLTLERLFSSDEFHGETFGPPRWVGAGYTVLEDSTTHKGSRDVVHYETATGRRQVWVSAGQLTPAGAGKPLAVRDYQWSKD